MFALHFVEDGYISINQLWKVNYSVKSKLEHLHSIVCELHYFMHCCFN